MRLAGGLANLGGDTDVWPVAADSPAVNLIPSCDGTDQRGVTRPQGAGCDSGAYERAPLRITNNPPTVTNNVHLVFEFTDDEPGATFECRDYIPADPPGEFIACTSGHTLRDLTDGVHVFQVRSVVGDVRSEPLSHTFTIDTIAPTPPTITEPADGTAVRQGVTLRGQTEPQTTVAVYVNGEPLGAALLDTGGWTFEIPELAEGTHAFTTVATDEADNASQPSTPVTVSVDRTPPAAPAVSGTPSGNSAAFAIGAAEDGVTLDAASKDRDGRRDSLRVRASGSTAGWPPGTTGSSCARPTAPATWPRRFAHSPSRRRTRRSRRRRRRSSARPPSRGRSAARCSSAARARNEFVELDGSESIPMGSTIDAKRGRVRITAETQQGRPAQRAEFYDGIFRITQTRALVDLRLVEELAPCSRRASAAQSKKPKSRKLWGKGKGKFRTTGSYSAATVRGTTWLVQDTCAGTLTRVTEGVVAVRDKRAKKTVLVRKGKRYLARARR